MLVLAVTPMKRCLVGVGAVELNNLILFYVKPSISSFGLIKITVSRHIIAKGNESTFQENYNEVVGTNVAP